MITSMSLGHDPYSLLFGTLGGYVLVYDIRFNTLSNIIKHQQRVPINSVEAFVPSRSYQLGLSKGDNNSPLAVVGAGSSTYEVTLLNLESGEVEFLLTVDDSRNKDLIAPPVVPSFSVEDHLANETNLSLFRRYLQLYRNQSHF